tara:strand:+ start:213 stop:455 length:243 start_codon:yes stop_codon:yes gene_type:complete
MNEIRNRIIRAITEKGKRFSQDCRVIDEIAAEVYKDGVYVGREVEVAEEFLRMEAEGLIRCKEIRSFDTLAVYLCPQLFS